MSPEESLGWRYTLGSRGYTFKSRILDEITKGKRAQKLLGPRTGTAAFKSCTKVPAKKLDKEVPER